MMTYATLAQAERAAKLDEVNNGSAAAVVAGRVFIQEALRFITERIDKITSYTFAPEIRTRYYDAIGTHIRGKTLDLDYPLLSVTSLTDGTNTALTQWDNTYANRPTAHYTLSPYDDTPALHLVGLESYAGWGVYTYGTDKAIAVVGTWGYRTGYPADAWLSSGDSVQDNPLSSSATALTVADADGLDSFGLPRFSPGQLLRIESEWVSVTAVNTVTNALTIRRAMRGSAAAAHIQNTAIEVFYPEPPIVRACLLWADYLYARRGLFDNLTVDALGIATQFPPDAPPEAQKIIEAYSLRKWVAQ